MTNSSRTGPSPKHIPGGSPEDIASSPDTARSRRGHGGSTAPRRADAAAEQPTNPRDALQRGQPKAGSPPREQHRPGQAAGTAEGDAVDGARRGTKNAPHTFDEARVSRTIPGG